MLAMRAGGMQWMIALWAVVESGLHRRVALRATTEERLPQNQIQNDAQTMRNHNGDHRPQHPVHAPARGVVVNVDDQQEIASKYGAGKKTKQSPDRRRRRVLLNRQQGRKQDLYDHKEQDSHRIGPLGDQTQLLGKLGAYVVS